MKKLNKRVLFYGALTLGVCSTLLSVGPSLASERSFPSVIYFDVDQQRETGMVSGLVSPKMSSQRTQKPSSEVRNTILVVDQPLDDFLKLAGRQFGVDVQLSHRLKTQIRNMKLAGGLAEILDQLAQEFEFAWYQQGDVVYVAPKGKSLSKMVYLGNMRFAEFSKNLSQAGLDVVSLKAKHIPSSNSVLVSGPASLIARVELVTEGYNKNAGGVTVIGFGKKR